MGERKSTNTWLVCGVIALVGLCIGGIVLALGGFGVLAWFGQDPEGLLVYVDAPAAVAAGQTFDLTVDLQNTTDKALTVDKIVLPSSLLQAAAVSAVQPQASAVNSGSYSFSINIPPGGEEHVTFRLKAGAKTFVSGDIEVHIGSRRKTAPLTLSIDAPPKLEVPTPAPKEDNKSKPTPVINEDPNPPVSGDEIAGVPYKAVVQIYALVNMEGKTVPAWSGSGSIITPGGLVLTNAHVVLSDRYYEVLDLVVLMTVKTDEQPVPTYRASIMQVDKSLDIAVIQIDRDLDGNKIDPAKLKLPTVPFGNDGVLNLGDAVTILGYPSIGGSTITLTRGEVAGFTAEEGYGNRAFIKTSATISGGNSGGLAANAKGEIIGIPTQLGYGGDDQYVDCRVLADTNRDGVVDDKDNCVPTGGFINALRPLHLAMPLIDAAKRGEVNIKEGVQGEQGSIPEEQGAQVVLSDNFSDPNSGWDDDAWDEGSVHYVNGEYQITVDNQNWVVWSYLSQDFDNAIVSVKTRIASPTGVGDYGILLRYVDNTHYYAFEVTEDGYFSIWKRDGDETIMVYDWEFSDAIPVSGTFTLNAAAVGNRLLIGVNDVLLADVTDDSFTSGKVGLIAGTLDKTGLTIAFDDFQVLEP